ncbi:MAG: hypothetical protein NDJ89_03090 [Oligoflexia bacterium]|nr:hypothetical protein [Oligoflexia bacterium]
MRFFRAIVPVAGLGVALAPLPLFADTITVDLTSSAYFDASNPANTASWDATNARIWTPAYANSVSLDFGTGADGAFDGTASQSGITVAGSSITIDTDAKAAQSYEYHFTSFSIPNGSTMTVTGSRPLVIRVLGSATISGSIVADGAPGSDQGGGTNAAGGPGAVGGGSGGRGSYYLGTPALAGNPIAGDVLGGGLGLDYDVADMMKDEGGGGGCNGLNADAYDAKSGFQGAGTQPASYNEGGCALPDGGIAANFETAFASGAGGGGGGGGGGAYWDGGVGYFNGGAGGAGGGAIQIAARGSITITSTGSISVKGGAGGNNGPGDNTDCGGGGGGGAGGSVWLQSGGLVQTSSGAIDISGGLGGGTGNCTGSGTYAGGNGSRGILRIDSPAFVTAPAYTVSPAVAAVTKTIGINGPSQNFRYYSKALSFASGYYSLSTPSETFGCGSDGSIAIAYEGSRDGITFEHPVPKERISELNDYPYLRFKTEITLPAGALVGTTYSPPCLTGLSIPFEPMDLSEFTLAGGLSCGTLENRSGTRSSGPGASAIAGDLGLLGLAYLLCRRRARGGLLPCKPA